MLYLFPVTFLSIIRHIIVCFSRRDKKESLNFTMLADGIYLAILSINTLAVL